MKSTSFFLFLTALIMACSGGGNQSTSTKSEQAPEQKAEIGATAEIVIESNDQMQFNLDKIEVVEGQTVRLTLKHVGTMSVEVMGHNWVLLTPGTDIPKFGNAAISAKEQGYIPEAFKENVIAFTQTIGGGEESTIEFDAPKPGYYNFICSFPGHYGVMQGSFVVMPR